jgi:hypothetical protein
LVIQSWLEQESRVPAAGTLQGQEIDIILTILFQLLQFLSILLKQGLIFFESY